MTYFALKSISNIFINFFCFSKYLCIWNTPDVWWHQEYLYRAYIDVNTGSFFFSFVEVFSFCTHTRVSFFNYFTKVWKDKSGSQTMHVCIGKIYLRLTLLKYIILYSYVCNCELGWLLSKKLHPSHIPIHISRYTHLM